MAEPQCRTPGDSLAFSTEKTSNLTLEEEWPLKLRMLQERGTEPVARRGEKRTFAAVHLASADHMRDAAGCGPWRLAGSCSAAASRDV